MIILSIQSAVAYGHVGNSAAGFTLQRLGHEVWRVDTVQFSNHTGYDGWRGEIFDPEQVDEVIAGIEDRGVLGQCDALLSGYVGDVGLGEVIRKANSRLFEANSEALYCCDPVLGDVGRGFYVDSRLPRFMRVELVPGAGIVTPNQFELEFLSGRRIDSLDQALQAADIVRATGPGIVLLTGLRRAGAAPETVEMMVVGKDEAWLVQTPLLQFEAAPNGAGDVVSALFLARYLESGELSQALGLTAASVFDLLRVTRDAGSRELRLIQAQDLLVLPRSSFEPQRIR